MAKPATEWRSPNGSDTFEENNEGFSLLLETGDKLLLENGDELLLESSVATPKQPTQWSEP